MLTVCHLTSAHAPGDTRIFYKECVSLAKAGYAVTLVQRGESGREQGVDIVGLGQPQGGRWKRMVSFTRSVYRAATKVDADIYHLHDPELLPYGWKLKRQGKTVIFDSHEFTAESILEKAWLPAPLRRLVHWAYQRFETAICRKLDGVITVSPHIAVYFSSINPNTVQVSNYPILEPDALRSDFSKQSVIFAGGIVEQWMHETILQALTKVPQCRYTLCGPCRAGYLERLQALPGWNQTDYLGKIPYSAVAQQMSHCMAGLALLRPNRNSDWQNGTMGNTKIFEEMMAGLPVICTDFVRWREFVGRYHCGICVNAESVDEIAAAMAYLMEHPAEARRMGENGRRAVEAEFNWKIEEQKLLAFYQAIS